MKKILPSLTLCGIFLLSHAGCRTPEMLPAGQEILTFLRQTAQGNQAPPPKDLQQEGNWQIDLTLYSQGEIKGSGSGHQKALYLALEEAVRNTVAPGTDLNGARFLVSVSGSSGKTFSFVEFNGEGKEITGDAVAIRHLDKNLIRQKTEAGKHYLLRHMNKEHYGFYKKYDAARNLKGTKLRTIYSASSLYTLMKINALKPEDPVSRVIPLIADFLLGMQSQESETRGAFHYAYDLKTGTKEPKFVVGTASKTIFTLLELYRMTQDSKYLEAAKSAGDWLLAMQNPDGSVINQKKLKDGQWVSDTRYSCLYLGQVLSAMSRLYTATSDPRYFVGAKKIAQLSAQRAAKQGYFMRDEYRLPDDPVPTSWMIMSLLDFYRATHQAEYKEIYLKCAEELLKRQLRDAGDILNYGRFKGTYATSGNGWINEILGEVLKTCREEGADCEKYKEAMILVSRWLIQNTYSEENTYFLRRPGPALGGLIRNRLEEAVRTDAVCHGVNGYVTLLGELEENWTFEVPEKP